MVISSPSPRVMVDRRSEAAEKVEDREANGRLLLCSFCALASCWAGSNVDVAESVEDDDWGGWGTSASDGGSTSTDGNMALGDDVEGDAGAASAVAAKVEGVVVDNASTVGVVATRLLGLGLGDDDGFTW